MSLNFQAHGQVRQYQYCWNPRTIVHIECRAGDSFGRLGRKLYDSSLAMVAHFTMQTTATEVQFERDIDTDKSNEKFRIVWVTET